MMENKYYLFLEKWSLDPNQWSMVLDISAVILAIIGVVFGAIAYRKQRANRAQEAFDFFQASLPELQQSMKTAIQDLKNYNNFLDLDKTINPILSVSLDDRFLNKINLLDLNRFYLKNRPKKLAEFKQLLLDANFFGNYHSYISREVNYFKDNYEEEKLKFSKWEIFLNNDFFKAKTDEAILEEFNEKGKQWTKDFNLFMKADKDHCAESPAVLRGNQKQIVNRISHLQDLVTPFIPEIDAASEIFHKADHIIAAQEDMIKMRHNFKTILEKDIARFVGIVSNINIVLE